MNENIDKRANGEAMESNGVEEGEENYELMEEIVEEEEVTEVRYYSEK